MEQTHPYGTIGHFSIFMLHTLHCLCIQVRSYTCPNVLIVDLILLSQIQLMGQVWIATFTKMWTSCKAHAK